MKICARAIIFVILFYLITIVFCSLHQDSVKYLNVRGTDGKWKTKTEWSYQWVREWIPKKVYVSTWKKVWTPIEVREWIPSAILPIHPHRPAWTRP